MKKNATLDKETQHTVVTNQFMHSPNLCGGWHVRVDRLTTGSGMQSAVSSALLEFKASMLVEVSSRVLSLESTVKLSVICNSVSEAEVSNTF